jgi:hypothetical protein
MRLNKSMMLGAVLVLAACGGKQVDDTEYVEATPDLSGVSLEINDEATDEGSKLTAADLGVYEAALNGQGPEYLEGARLQVKALNTALKDVVTHVVELSNGDVVEAQQGDVLVYGPKAGANATWQLKVKKTGDKRFAWKLEARPLNSTDDAAYKLVAAGRLVRGEKAHRGRGTIGVNLDNLKQVVPSSTGQGKLMASFAHTAGDDKALAYRLAGFTPNPANHDAVTGSFVGYKLMPSRITRIRVVGQKNLEQTATAAKENIASTIRFKRGVGGRADVVVFGGDIAADHFYLGSACWDALEQEKFKVLRYCTRGATGQRPTCEQVSIAGTRAACPADDFLNDVDDPTQAPGTDGTAQEPGSPESPDDVPSDVTAEF